MTPVLHRADGRVAMNNLVSCSIDCVITDPVYDQPYDIDVLLRVSRGNVIVFCDPRQRPNCVPDEILHWVKTPSTKNNTRNCSRFVEEILVFRKGTTFNRLHWSCMTGVFNDAVMDNPTLHPWQKPTSLMEKLVRIYSKPGDMILDPFMGSGTTGVAAKSNGRGFLGYEIDENTYNIACKRII